MWREKDSMNKEAQCENNKRIYRVHQYNREKVLDKHNKYQERNEQSKVVYLAKQCQLRSQSVIENCVSEDALECLKKLQRHDPEKQDERDILRKKIVALNKKLSLGLNLDG